MCIMVGCAEVITPLQGTYTEQTETIGEHVLCFLSSSPLSGWQGLAGIAFVAWYPTVITDTVEAVPQPLPRALPQTEEDNKVRLRRVCIMGTGVVDLRSVAHLLCDGSSILGVRRAEFRHQMICMCFFLLRCMLVSHSVRCSAVRAAGQLAALLIEV